MKMTSDVQAVVAELNDLCADLEAAGKPVAIMEICGTHTVSLFRTGAKSLLPSSLRLVSGPGCPVCVTSQGYIDLACDLAAEPDVIIATYGDMVRVPGARGSLETMRGEGAEIAVVYSARDAVKLAEENPTKRVIFLSVGFETTTPGTALSVLEAENRGIDNLLILAQNKLVIPAMHALLGGGEMPINGFLCPGHVSIVIGSDAYKPIADQYGKPCVVAGFELHNMLLALLHIVRQVAAGENRVENVYSLTVTEPGNLHAQAIVDKVFQPCDAVWRAIGMIPASGLELREEYGRFDALSHFDLEMGPDVCPAGCICGEVIQGQATPAECKLFGTGCTPIKPVGPCMVSSEGTCAAWFRYNRNTARTVE
ncbi:MAG: hydrogenase formation protein HypD [bacterium]|nr:hydrogenase formation protein HypD [bacterium]